MQPERPAMFKLARPLAALALTAALGGPGRADETPDTGAYLAARVAESGNDFRAAAGWYGKAILSDSGNAQLLEGAILANLGKGDFSLAIDAARQLDALGGETSQLGEVVLAADEAARGDYTALLAGDEAGRDLGDLVDALVAEPDQGTGSLRPLSQGAGPGLGW
jgi:hypothetical protein